MNIPVKYTGGGKYGAPRDLRIDGRADDPAFNRPIIAVSITDRKVMEDRCSEILGGDYDMPRKTVQKLDQVPDEPLTATLKSLPEDHSKCSKCIHVVVCRYKDECEQASEWALCRFWKEAG